MGDSLPGVLGTKPSAVADAWELDAILPPGGAGAAARGPVGTCAPVAHTTGLHICGWPRKIGWDEFQEYANRPTGVKEDAEIHSEGGGDDNATMGKSGKRFLVTAITVTMTVESDSWVVKDKKSDYLLNHEQGHFDITALLWRDMSNEILRIRAQTTSALESEVKRVMARYGPIFKKMNDRYDAETGHSLKQDVQGKWDKKISHAMTTGKPLR